MDGSSISSVSHYGVEENNSWILALEETDELCEQRGLAPLCRLHPLPDTWEHREDLWNPLVSFSPVTLSLNSSVFFQG